MEQLAHCDWMRIPLLRSYYGDSGYFNVGYWAEDTETQAEACRQLMDRLLAPVPSQADAVLDVGCGTGATTAFLEERFGPSTLTGINVSDWQLEAARRRVPEAHFVRMDAAELDFPDGSFDLVVSVEAAFLFETRARFFAEARRVLRPGGYLVLSDILYERSPQTDALVPPENRTLSVADYALGYRQAGFASVAIEDATDPCWNSFCDRMASWSGALQQKGQLAQGSILTSVSAGMPVRSYLLVTARKGQQ